MSSRSIGYALSLVLASCLVGCKSERRPDPDDGATDAGSHDAGDGGPNDGGGNGGNDAGGNDAGNPNIEPTGLTGITAAHNTVRANATPTPAPALPPLTWSGTVTTAAQNWADGCVYAHSSNGYGENIYASTGHGATGTNAVNSWSSEAADYNYAANTCAMNESCGHYTQVVWRTSTQLGCGIKRCTTNSPFDVSMYGPNWTLIVCDYSPAGNNGSRPY
jgi:pathogenesis-related protein 1